MYEADAFRVVNGRTIVNLGNLYEVYPRAPRWRTLPKPTYRLIHRNFGVPG